MTQPTFDLAINPAAVMPEPGIFPKEQILKIVRTCVRPLRTFRGVQVVWHTDPRPMLGNDTTERAWIVVSLGSTGGIGCEELRTQLNVDTNDREALLVAQRKFTMTLRAYSLDPKLEAFDVLNRVRFYINTAPGGDPSMAPQPLLPDGMDPRYLRQEVAYNGSEAPGTNGSLRAFSTSAGMRMRCSCGLAEARVQ